MRWNVYQRYCISGTENLIRFHPIRQNEEKEHKTMKINIKKSNSCITGGAEPQGGGIVGPILPPINQNDPQVVTDYCGNLIYRNDTLTMLLMEEGYVTFATSGTPTYHYYLKDHLGSVRIVMRQDGTVEQRNQYYPDGTLFGKQSTNGTVQPYKFGGKELERTLPLDEYDFGARWMDPTVGARFTTMDPLAEKYYSISPYAYCGGNPINLIDPTGKEWEIGFENGRLSINVTVNLTYDESLSEDIISNYKEEISSTLNSIITKTSKGSITASVTFFKGNEDISQELVIGKGADPQIAGFTSDMASFVNAYDRLLQLKSPKDLAIDAAHELFHTIGLEHPFEINQTADTQLINVGNNRFISTIYTDPNINHNVMNYESTIIDGVKCSDLQSLTMGQLQLIVNEILYINN